MGLAVKGLIMDLNKNRLVVVFPAFGIWEIHQILEDAFNGEEVVEGFVCESLNFGICEGLKKKWRTSKRIIER